MFALSGPVRTGSLRAFRSAYASSYPSSYASSYASSSGASVIFDLEVKAAQRERAAYLLNPADDDPLHLEVASRVVERVLDCTKQFRRALILGGAGSSVLRELLSTPAGDSLESVVLADHSKAMLARCGDRLEGRPGIKATYHWMDPGDADERVGLRVGDDEGEEGDEGAKFDLVVSCLHLHWVNDIPGVMTQCRDMMAPDGFFLGAMLGGETLQEMRIACTLAQQERAGGVAPRTSPAVHVRDAGNLLTRAGFQLPAVDVDDVVVNYDDPFAVVEHLRCMGEQASLRLRTPLSEDVALAAAAVYSTMFGEKSNRSGAEGAGRSGVGRSGSSGRSGRSGAYAGERNNKWNEEVNKEEGNGRTHVPASYQIIYLSGWSKSNDQAKPRQRGSATVSFHELETHFKASD